VTAMPDDYPRCLTSIQILPA